MTHPEWCETCKQWRLKQKGQWVVLYYEEMAQLHSPIRGRLSREPCKQCNPGESR